MSSRLLSNRAAAYLRLNNFEAAVKDAEACVSIEPLWAKGYTRLAQAFYRVQDYDKAEAAVAKLEELEPDNRNVASLRER